ncbi:DUF6279 family lipoprotein [Rubrivivax gelatinosus]|uniref:Lipoprotein n=1 Tax=Rubrivivax gelatinosus TaxID=28068 RepID=A0A4V2SHL1_RUBGE|nr:DUF6279 family lipoprotein [Rubrivivax gelatinosus]TCP05548.1 hypothetical protein EV684_101420 [Rubrivivax gelatinosus]
MKAAIIAVALVLAGCSTLRLGYDNGPRLAWWWLDGYVDFDSRQAPAVHAAIARWFAWHRANELPRYAALLQEAGAALPQATTPEAVCRWTDRLRETPAAAVDRALREAVPLVAGLGEPQLRHLEQRYAKRLDEMREEYLQPDPAERRNASVERGVERFEELYGRLDAAQRRVVADGVADSPWDPQTWIAERDRRQREVVQTLRRLVAERADADTTLAALRTLASRSERSADPAYREFQARLDAYNCGFAARVHNATTPAQREHARDRLAGWEGDLRALAAAAAAPVAAVP